MPVYRKKKQRQTCSKKARKTSAYRTQAWPFFTSSLSIGKEHNVDLTQVTGTGADDRITRKELKLYVAAGKPTSQDISNDEQPTAFAEPKQVALRKRQHSYTSTAY